MQAKATPVHHGSPVPVTARGFRVTARGLSGFSRARPLRAPPTVPPRRFAFHFRCGLSWWFGCRVWGGGMDKHHITVGNGSGCGCTVGIRANVRPKRGRYVMFVLYIYIYLVLYIYLGSRALRAMASRCVRVARSALFEFKHSNIRIFKHSNSEDVRYMEVQYKQQEPWEVPYLWSLRGRRTSLSL